MIPSSLLRVLRADDTSIWFLGYSLSLWNQRVILRRLWQEKIKESGKPWWAIQEEPNPLDTRIWKRYLVKVLQHPDFRLEDYISEIDTRLHANLQQISTVSTAASLASTSREGIFISYSHTEKKMAGADQGGFGTRDPLRTIEFVGRHADQAGFKMERGNQGCPGRCKGGVVTRQQSFPRLRIHCQF